MSARAEHREGAAGRILLDMKGRLLESRGLRDRASFRKMSSPRRRHRPNHCDRTDECGISLWFSSSASRSRGVRPIAAS